MSEFLFDDIFKVEEVDPDGKKYDKVSRIVAKSEKCDMYMLLDLHTELYPLNKNERFLMVLSPSLVLNTKVIKASSCLLLSSRIYSLTRRDTLRLQKNHITLMASCIALWPTRKTYFMLFLIIIDGKVSIQEKFEYIMHGRLYNITQEGSEDENEVEVYTSFGGLQMMLRGNSSHCLKFVMDQNMFLLLRKIES